MSTADHVADSVNVFVDVPHVSRSGVTSSLDVGRLCNHAFKVDPKSTHSSRSCGCHSESQQLPPISGCPIRIYLLLNAEFRPCVRDENIFCVTIITFITLTDMERLLLSLRWSTVVCQKT